MKSNPFMNIFILCCFIFFAKFGYSAVDPDWLNSWNLAQSMRPESISSNGRIATKDEPGVPFIVNGRVFEPDGSKPAAGVIVHAYHRDNAGLDFGTKDKLMKTWRLQGWTITDIEGRFTFHTIRPAPDQLGREGAHIHITTVSEKYGRQWARTIFLLDDPIVPLEIKTESKSKGDFGWVREVKTIEGIENISVNILLKRQTDF